MDAAVLILTALQATSVASSIVSKSDIAKDAYASLRSHIQDKFVGRPGAELALIEYEADPETWEAPLRKALVQVQADQDKDIIDAARRVMKFITPPQSEVGKYNVQISGNVQGFAQGDSQSIIMHFGNESKEK